MSTSNNVVKYRDAKWVTLLEDLKPISAPASAQAQPIPMDMNGDLKIDLLGMTPSTVFSGEFKVWQNAWNASQPTSMFNLYVACPLMYIACSIQTAFFHSRIDADFDGTQCRLANPHSNAAVDLNGDCLAGVIRLCRMIFTCQ